MRKTTRRFQALALFTSSLIGVTALSSDAHAEEVKPTGKGIVGGALLGAEVVVIAESIFGVRSGALYAIGAGVGGIGGGVGGYFIEQSSTDGRVPVYILAGGLALAIPAIVLTLNATRYQADETATEDKAPTNVDAADPGKLGGSVVIGGGGATPAPAPTPAATPAPAPAAPSPPQSFLNLNEGKFRIGLPAPRVTGMWSSQEQKNLGVKQGTELRMPLIAVRF